jgi:hypothetical protein
MGAEVLELTVVCASTDVRLAIKHKGASAAAASKVLRIRVWFAEFELGAGKSFTRVGVLPTECTAVHPP